MRRQGFATLRAICVCVYIDSAKYFLRVEWKGISLARRLCKWSQTFVEASQSFPVLSLYNFWQETVFLALDEMKEALQISALNDAY